jgi:hypothetical protein
MAYVIKHFVGMGLVDAFRVIRVEEVDFEGINIVGVFKS